MKVPELKVALKARALSEAGKEEELVDRLIAHLA